jgi:kumamolisin
VVARHVCALGLIAAGVFVLASDLHPSVSGGAGLIGGPYASLLASSTDLGPSHRSDTQLTVALRDSQRPDALFGWADDNGLSVRWRPGVSWAVVEGAAENVAKAFDVEVHDYRGQRGQVFYASPQQPSIPESLRGEVAEFGRILGYTPHHMSRPSILPLDVPDRGLTPGGLLNTYNANRLAADGYTGKGTTIVFFAFDGFEQADLDTFTTTYGLPRFTPTVVGGQPGEAHGETTMDLEVAHAVAPDAQKVVINARPTVEGDGGYEKIGQMLEDADRHFPGAVWSFSIGWGCDKLITAADLASLPEMVDVGGTTLSTDANGVWQAEQAWFDVPLSQGTGGGVSSLFDRPEWQRAVMSAKDPTRRLTPDVAAVADPFTGVRIVFDQQQLVGGGTSQSAPIWAGLAAVMNQYLMANGGHALGDLNPLLYRIAAGAPLPGFRDVILGGNAVDTARPGYDLVTGLGTPDIDNLVRNLLVLQKAT